MPPRRGLELWFGVNEGLEWNPRQERGVCRCTVTSVSGDACHVHRSEILGSGQAWLTGVTLGSGVTSCRSQDVQKDRSAFFWAYAGGE